MKIHLGFVMVSFAAIFAVCGCGEGRLAAVKGRVTRNGQPLPGATVRFQPVNGKRPSSAVTDVNGTYALLYAVNEPGAEIGKHTIEIFAEETKKDDTLARSPETGRPKRNPRNDLEREVKPGRNEFDFELTALGARN